MRRVFTPEPAEQALSRDVLERACARISASHIRHFMLRSSAEQTIPTEIAGILDDHVASWGVCDILSGQRKGLALEAGRLGYLVGRALLATDQLEEVEIGHGSLDADLLSNRVTRVSPLAIPSYYVDNYRKLALASALMAWQKQNRRVLSPRCRLQHGHFVELLDFGLRVAFVECDEALDRIARHGDHPSPPW